MSRNNERLPACYLLSCLDRCETEHFVQAHVEPVRFRSVVPYLFFDLANGTTDVEIASTAWAEAARRFDAARAPRSGVRPLVHAIARNRAINANRQELSRRRLLARLPIRTSCEDVQWAAFDGLVSDIWRRTLVPLEFYRRSDPDSVAWKRLRRAGMEREGLCVFAVVAFLEMLLRPSAATSGIVEKILAPYPFLDPGRIRAALARLLEWCIVIEAPEGALSAAGRTDRPLGLQACHKKS